MMQPTGPRDGAFIRCIATAALLALSALHWRIEFDWVRTAETPSTAAPVRANAGSKFLKDSRAAPRVVPAPSPGSASTPDAMSFPRFARHAARPWHVVRVTEPPVFVPDRREAVRRVCPRVSPDCDAPHELATV